MKLYNLVKDLVKVDKREFIEVVNAGKFIGITPEGEIIEAKEGSLPKNLYIYAGVPKPIIGSAVTKATPLAKTLGENYDIKDEGEKISISAAKAWEEIVESNSKHTLYLDAAGEGISEFSDEELDNLIWYSCEFDINYREVAEFLESSQEGTILCIEREEPYIFNGIALIDNLQKAREDAYRFIQNELKSGIESGKIELDDLTDEEIDALKFFEISL